MTKITSEIVADSINQQGDRLISVLATFPRIILSEMNTHRMLSKNTSSSRAIPFNKMLEAVQKDPFIPIAWQKHHSGMQGNEYFTGINDIKEKEMYWLTAKSSAINMAQKLHNHSTTKQLCNRLLEPFMWTTMLITGSKQGWDNFFKLRTPKYEYKLGAEKYCFNSWKDLLKFIKSTTNNKDYFDSWKNETLVSKLLHNKGQAEIHIMALAESIWDSVNESTPRLLEMNQWHIPFIDKINSEELNDILHKINYVPKNIISGVDFLTQAEINISVALAARTSYTVIGEEKEIDYQKMIDLHDKLLAQDPKHSSPLEHCCRALSNEEYKRFFKGKIINVGCETETYEDDSYSEDVLIPIDGQGWVNNIKGFMPYRYIVDNELTL